MPDTIIALRCAVHPGRPAVDRCPRCDRPRCDEDASSHGAGGCVACYDEPTATRQATPLESFIGAAQVIIPVAVIGGWIYSQYVEVHIFSWLVPILIGVAGSSPGSFLRRPQPRAYPPVVGAIAGLLGTAFGFRLFPHGPHDPLHPLHEVGLPYLCAIAAAVLWPVLLGPPRTPKPPLV